MTDKHAAVGVDLGATNLKIAVVDRVGAVLAATTTPIAAHDGPDAVLAEIVEGVHAVIKAASRAKSQIVGVGVGTPGPLDLKKGVIVQAANLPGWQDVPVRAYVQEKLGLPVVLENDGNAAAYGEYWVGAGRDGNAALAAGKAALADSKAANADSKAANADRNAAVAAGGDMVMLTLGTGVGCGVIIDGRILHGHFDNAAELGHMIVAAGGLACPCGQRGCLERYASASAVARHAKAAVEAGEKSSLADRVRAGNEIDAESVAQHATAGDEVAKRIWDEACNYLAVACINIQHAYNPRRVVLGGGMALAGDFLLDRVRHHLQAGRWTLHDDLPEVTIAHLGYDAGTIGAAGLAWLAA